MLYQYNFLKHAKRGCVPVWWLQHYRPEFPYIQISFQIVFVYNFIFFLAFHNIKQILQTKKSNHIVCRSNNVDFDHRDHVINIRSIVAVKKIIHEMFNIRASFLFERLLRNVTETHVYSLPLLTFTLRTFTFLKFAQCTENCSCFDHRRKKIVGYDYANYSTNHKTCGTSTHGKYESYTLYKRYNCKYEFKIAAIKYPADYLKFDRYESIFVRQLILN